MEKKISSNRFETDTGIIQKKSRVEKPAQNFEFRKSATQKWSEQRESVQTSKKPRSPTRVKFVQKDYAPVKASRRNRITKNVDPYDRYVKDSDKKKNERKKNKKEAAKQVKTGNAESRFANEVQQTATRFTDAIMEAVPEIRYIRKDSKTAKKIEQDRQTRKFREQKSKEEEIVQTFLDVRKAIIKNARRMMFQGHIKMAVTGFVIATVVTNVVLTTCLGSCGYAMTDGLLAILYGVSPAGDFDMTDCESYFGEKEMNLSLLIDNVAEDYPDCDEYVINADPIGHDSIKLMAFLSAVYQTYDLRSVQDVLDEIFDELYSLAIEVETTTETESVYNEDTGEYEDVEKETTTLTLTLETGDFDDILEDRIPDDDTKKVYEIYLDTGGGHQTFYNPFTIDWTSKITSHFGWRVHPIYEDARFHYGVDIGMLHGEEIHSCSTGKVITAGFYSSEGNYIVIQDETGYTAHYMHLSEIDVSVGDEVTHGDVIGKVGSTGDSTGPHLHLGIKDADGNWLNPEFMVSKYTGGIS